MGQEVSPFEAIVLLNSNQKTFSHTFFWCFFNLEHFSSSQSLFKCQVRCMENRIEKEIESEMKNGVKFIIGEFAAVPNVFR